MDADANANANANANDNANANADDAGSTIALPERCSGELKRKEYVLSGAPYISAYFILIFKYVRLSSFDIRNLVNVTIGHILHRHAVVLDFGVWIISVYIFVLSNCTNQKRHATRFID